jgi:hypothetical protein
MLSVSCLALASRNTRVNAPDTGSGDDLGASANSPIIGTMRQQPPGEARGCYSIGPLPFRMSWLQVGIRLILADLYAQRAIGGRWQKRSTNPTGDASWRAGEHGAGRRSPIRLVRSVADVAVAV